MRDREITPALPRFGVAVASVALAVVLRLLLGSVLGGRFPFATLFAAVLISAAYGGFGPAVAATALGGLASVLFLLPANYGLSGEGVVNLGGLLLYLAVGLGIACIGGALRAARHSAELSARRASAEREQLRTTLRSIGDAVIATDTGGNITSMNPVAEELVGGRADEAIGRPLAQVFHIVNERTRKPVVDPVARVLAEGRIVGLANHTVLIAEDGTERPIDDSAAPIRDSQGNLIGVVLVFRDVTERRRSEEALRRSEQDLNDFFDNANVGLHWVGPDGTVLRVNQAELDLLGYAHDEYVGRPIADFHADRPVIDDILRRLGNGEKLSHHPARLRCKDGSLKDVLINSSVLWDEGRFVHTRCFTLDVTERRRTEERLRTFAQVVEQSADFIGICSADMVPLFVNEAGRRMVGLDSMDEVRRTNVLDYFWPEDRERIEREAIPELLRDHRWRGEVRFRNFKTGKPIHTMWNVTAIRDDAGEPIAWATVSPNLDSLKATEATLRESEERFRMLADNITQFAWMADERGRVFWYNRRWFDYTGTTLEEMQGEGWIKVHHPDHVERVVARIQHSIDTGEVWEDTFPLRGADGGYRWFLSRATPIRDERGHVLRWFGTNTDITDQREAEESLREADRRKDEFLATLAHELRNPLAPVRSSLELMKRAKGDANAIEQARATMDRQMSHLERLVDDLLDVSRITRDRLELRPVRLELASVVHQAVEACGPLAETYRHEVDVAMPPEPIYLRADPVRLAQVVSNLLSNACKYTDPGGHIWLTVRHRGDEAEISVKDNGLGISSDMLLRVFDMFTQVPGSAERLQGGLGIGLTLVRRLAEMHGGRVEAFSEGLNRGSEFVVSLPVLHDEVDATPLETTLPRVDQPYARLRILVVDDNRDAATSLSTLLNLLGHETTLAHDGQEAVEAAETFRPDLVLLDIGLPKLNGYEAAQKIREQSWGKSIVLVALTGWGQDQDRRRSMETGFDHHLVKPVDVESLTTLLSSLSGGSSAGSGC